VDRLALCLYHHAHQLDGTMDHLFIHGETILGAKKSNLIIDLNNWEK
jgi:hypothetical protein